MDSIVILFLIKGIIIGSIYALISLGFNVIYRTTGVLNFAQGEFVMMGGVVSAWALTGLGWPLALSLLVGVLAAGLVGLLMDLLAIRPVRKQAPVMQIIVTIGAAIVIKSAVSLIWGTEPHNLPVIKEGAIRLAGTEVDYQSLITIAVAGVCMLLLTLYFRHTTTGRAMKACAESPESARLCGVSIGKMSAISFGMSALLGGIGGILVTPVQSMSFDGGTMLGLKGFAAAIIGGLGNPVGGVVGGLVLGLAEQYGAWKVSEFKDVLALALVVAVLLVRPRGLLTK